MFRLNKSFRKYISYLKAAIFKKKKVEEMIENTVTLIYFSPTDTTRKILLEISKGIGISNPQIIDLTTPFLRSNNDLNINGDLVVIGVPVYEERVPSIIKPLLERIDRPRRSVVLVAVYGNVGEGIALEELSEITKKAGMKVIAAASFVAEHSFSSAYANVAKGRPDQDDLEKARHFGTLIIDKLNKYRNIDYPIIEMKGHLPFMAKILPKNSAGLFTKIPEVDRFKCLQCGICLKKCPVGAINTDMSINNNLCLRCFACVKRCPVGARKISYKMNWLVIKILKRMGKERKEPKIYI